MDFQNGQGIRSLGNIVSKQDIANFEKFQKDLQNGISYHKAFNNNLANSHSYIQQQASSLRELITQRNLLNRQLRTGKITQEEYNTAITANQAQITALTTKTQTLTLAQKAGIAISKAFGTALNIALNVGVTLAISAIITGITKLVNAQQEAKEKIEEQARSAKQLSDDLFDLRKQYITLSKEVETDSSKKEQLKSVTEELLKKLGYEKEAVGDLVDEYGNLDNAINGVSLTALEEAGNALRVEYGNKKSALAKDKNIFDDIFNSGNGRLYSFLIPSGKTINSDVAKALNDSGIFNKNTSFGIDSGKIYLNGSIFSVDEMKQNYQDISDALSLLNSKFKLDVIKDDSIYKALQSKQDELKKVIDEYNSSINNLNTNLAQQEILKGLQGRELPKTKEEFDTFAESVINASVASEQFIGSEKDIRNSVMAFLETMPEFSSFFVVEQKNVGDTTKSFSDLKEETKSLQETLDSTFSNQSTLQSAFDKIQEGTSLSADEVLELVEVCGDKFPEISTMFEKTADGWTIATDDLINANDAIIESVRDMIQDLIDGYKKVIEEYENRQIVIPTPTMDWTTGGIPATVIKTEFDTDITQGDYETAVNGLAEANLWMEMFGLTTEDTANKYSDMADEVSTKTKLITTAIDEMNDTGHISASTYAKIAEMGGNFADCLEIQNGQLVLNTEKLKELETQEYQNAISANNLAIAREALRVGSVYDSQAYEKFKKQLEEENAFYQSIIDEINGANGGGSTGDPIKEAFEKDMAETEHLHNMELMSDEEYYNALEKANNDHYKNSLDHESEYNSNLEKIFNGRKQIYKNNVDDEVALLDERLGKGIISAEQYKEQVIGLAEKYYGQGSKYYDTDFATENFETLEDKALNVDDQIYEDRLKALKETEGDSLESHNEFIAEWKALNKEIYKDLNPKKYKENLDEIEKYEEDFYKSRVENEKTYWENQQKALEDYYDEKIKKLQDEADEEERITKQKELQLNLIKAQQDLLNAKKNRNQLVFANGGFEYDYNQDDIISKMEAVADAEKDIANNIRDTQIEELENEKESRSQWFEKLIDKIDEYLKMLNGEVTPTESDTSILNDVIKTTEGKDSDIKTFTSFSQLLDKMGISYNKEAVNKIDNDSTASQQFFNNIAKTPNVPNLTPAVNYNNSTVNNNSKVDIGNMTINVPEGTTKEQVRSMIDQFANNVIASLRAKATQIQ